MARNRSGSFALGLIIGGVVGVLSALLLAPKKGSATRSDFLERSMAIRAKAEEWAAQARSQAQDRAAASVTTAREHITPQYENVRERVTPVVEQVSSRIGRNAAGNSESPQTEDDSQQGKA